MRTPPRAKRSVKQAGVQLELCVRPKAMPAAPVIFSHESDQWTTDDEFYRGLCREFNFTLDPCSNGDNAKRKDHYTVRENGLLQDWGDKCVFVNPPDSQVAKWMEKAFCAAKAGATCVCLVGARTDTRWWHDFAMKGEVRFIKGRLKFGGAKNSAPFPSAVVVFRPPAFALKTMSSTTQTKP